MKVAVLTAIYDSYDSLKPIIPQKDADVEFVCVTDDDSIDETTSGSQGWTIVVEPRPHLHPNRAAKTPKCLPWLYTDAEVSIWIDASYQITSPHFVRDVIHYVDTEYPIAQFKHPWRDCAYAEADESLKLPKYFDQIDIIQDQKWDLRNIYGHPPNWGLWATGVIVRKHTNQAMSMGFDWLHQIYMYSYQDQLSHPNAVRMHIGHPPIELPGTHLHNDWLSYQGSARHG